MDAASDSLGRMRGIAFVLLAGLSLACDGRPAPSFVEVLGAGIERPGDAWPDGTYFLPEIMGPGVALADIDGDGDLDIVTAEQETLEIYFQTAPGRFDPTPFGLPVTAGLASLAVADVDGDGDLDVVSADLANNDLQIFWGGR